MMYNVGPNEPHNTVGTKVVSELHQGNEGRRCTDVRGGYLFFFVFGAALIVAMNGAKVGNPGRLHKGVNYNGKACGTDHLVEDLPYLYFPLNPNTTRTELSLHDGRCVAYCPDEEDVQASKTVPVTRRITDVDGEGASFLTVEYNLYTPVYHTFVSANAYCIPKDEALREQVLPGLAAGWKQVAFAVGGLENSWHVVFAYTAMSIVSAVGYSYLMKHFATFAVVVNVIYLVVIALTTGFVIMFQ
eukprot:Trichotokara_eunicae@DN6480_c0_g1_i1.p1